MTSLRGTQDQQACDIKLMSTRLTGHNFTGNTRVNRKEVSTTHQPRPIIDCGDHRGCYCVTVELRLNGRFLPIGYNRARKPCKRFVFLVNDRVLSNNYLGGGELNSSLALPSSIRHKIITVHQGGRPSSSIYFHLRCPTNSRVGMRWQPGSSI
jgi:hypothetical protein